jgi:opacity protein-like surface antigen
VSLGRAGQLTFEPLAGGRLIWVHESLGGPNQKASDSATVIDPIIGGRITYYITDTLELWFRGDVGGFGISDNQLTLTYNLIAGLNWRFADHWSALAGWRYMDIDLQKGSGARTLARPLVLRRVEPTVNTFGIGVIRRCLCLLGDGDRGVWMRLSLVHCPGAA